MQQQTVDLNFFLLLPYNNSHIAYKKFSHFFSFSISLFSMYVYQIALKYIAFSLWGKNSELTRLYDNNKWNFLHFYSTLSRSFSKCRNAKLQWRKNCTHFIATNHKKEEFFSIVRKEKVLYVCRFRTEEKKKPQSFEKQEMERMENIISKSFTEKYHSNRRKIYIFSYLFHFIFFSPSPSREKKFYFFISCIQKISTFYRSRIFFLFIFRIFEWKLNFFSQFLFL